MPSVGTLPWLSYILGVIVLCSETPSKLEPLLAALKTVSLVQCCSIYRGFTVSVSQFIKLYLDNLLNPSHRILTKRHRNDQDQILSSYPALLIFDRVETLRRFLMNNVCRFESCYRVGFCQERKLCSWRPVALPRCLSMSYSFWYLVSSFKLLLRCIYRYIAGQSVVV